MRIMLACAQGMSTSLLVAKMKEAAELNEVDVEIFAAPEAEIPKHKAEIDIVLLGPQVAYLLEDTQEVLADTNIPVTVINSVDYGMLNGGKVLDVALKLIEKNKEGEK